jgi:hypothetical protein
MCVDFGPGAAARIDRASCVVAPLLAAAGAHVQAGVHCRCHYACKAGRCKVTMEVLSGTLDHEEKMSALASTMTSGSNSTPDLSVDNTFTSAFIDPAAARKAVQLVLPMLDAAVASREAGASGFLYIVILHPGASPANGAFEDAILHEHAVGDPAGWDADYAHFARAKARLSWRTGRDTSAVLAQAPQLLAPGDTILPGAVLRHDMVVAVSGADPWYDDAFADAIAQCLFAQARKALVIAAREGVVLASGT